MTSGEIMADLWNDFVDTNENPIERFVNGGPGSGNFGHAGRPGEVGGSAPTGSSSADYFSALKDPEERKHMLEVLRRGELIEKTNRMKSIKSFDEAHIAALREAGFTEERIQKMKERVLAKQLVSIEKRDKKKEAKASPEQTKAIDNIVSKVKMEPKDEKWLRNNCDPEMAQAFSDEVDKANEMGIKNIRLVLNDSKATYGRMGYIAIRDEYQLVITKGILRDANVVRRNREASGPNGSRYKTSESINATFAHEFGHSMEMEFAKSLVGNRKIAESTVDMLQVKDACSAQIVSQAMKNLDANGISIATQRENKNRKYISEYGRTNTSEAIAESFAGPNFSELTKEIHDIATHKKSLSPEVLKALNNGIDRLEKRYTEYY